MPLEVGRHRLGTDGAERMRIDVEKYVVLFDFTITNRWYFEQIGGIALFYLTTLLSLYCQALLGAELKQCSTNPNNV